MLKKEATTIFVDKSTAEVAEILGITADGFKYWPKELNRERSDRVRGAAMRLGYPIPDRLRHCYYNADGKLIESDPVGRKWESTR